MNPTEMYLKMTIDHYDAPATHLEQQSPVIFHGDQIDILNWFHNSTSDGYLITSSSDKKMRRENNSVVLRDNSRLFKSSLSVSRIDATCFSALCSILREKISHDMLTSIAGDNTIKHVFTTISSAFLLFRWTLLLCRQQNFWNALTYKLTNVK